MIYDWYKITNLDDFEALSLPSRKYTVILEGHDTKEILVTKGHEVSVLIDGIFLTVQLNDKNPFEFEDRAVFLDENNDIWVGIKTA